MTTNVRAPRSTNSDESPRYGTSAFDRNENEPFRPATPLVCETVQQSSDGRWEALAERNFSLCEVGMKTLIVVDGTGVYNGIQYEHLFRGSFCKQVDEKGKKAHLNVSYFQGPGAAGISTGTSIGGEARQHLEKAYRLNRNEKIYLMGYSRGGACAIQLAKWANNRFDLGPAETRGGERRDLPVPKAPIEIEAMFLLDPVDKDMSISGDGIPSNVKRCYLLYRDKPPRCPTYDLRLNTGDYMSMVDVIAAASANAMNGADLDVFARGWMGNCKVEREWGNARTVIQKGLGGYLATGVINSASNGAAGGVPWVVREADKLATENAAKAINHWFDKEHIGIKVSESYFAKADRKRFRSDAYFVAEQTAREAPQKARDAPSLKKAIADYDVRGTHGGRER